MKTFFVDANVFLRFFTKDDRGLHQKAADLFHQAASGKITLITGPPVLFEIAWVLRSAYKQPQEKVLAVLTAVAAFPGLRLTDEGLVEEAISQAKYSGREFADAYICASVKDVQADGIATFNRKHFEKLGADLYSFK
ncbi:MAG: PIN domain-containing protein [Pseudomonadota bacterium]